MKDREIEKLTSLSLSLTAVVISMVRPSYTVREDVGQVEVCVHVTTPSSGCPVAYNFSVLILSVTGSASMYHCC